MLYAYLMSSESLQFSHRRISRVLWALDPFESDLRLDPQTVADLNRWTKSRDILVEPTYVFTPISGIESMPKEKIVERLITVTRELNAEVARPSVLLNLSGTVAGAVDEFLDHAEHTDAGLILVSSHGRRGFPRMLFGSFAETLLNLSNMPLLFLNHHARPEATEFERVLWATDFSEACEHAFDSFLFQANGACRELVLFHDASLTFELSSYFSRWEINTPFSLEMENDHKTWAERRAQEWLDRAGRFGIQGTTYIDSHYGDIAAEILTAAKANRSGLVVMASQRGPFASILLGSQARKVVRASEIPVWLYGVHFCELSEVAEKARVGGAILDTGI